MARDLAVTQVLAGSIPVYHPMYVLDKATAVQIKYEPVVMVDFLIGGHGITEHMRLTVSKSKFTKYSSSTYTTDFMWPEGVEPTLEELRVRIDEQVAHAIKLCDG